MALISCRIPRTHRKTSLAFMIGASITVACTGSTGSSENVQIETSAIQGGQPETGFLAVGDVLTVDDGGGSGGGGSGIQPDTNGTCTGTLVHPSFVLTAKHCTPSISFRVGTSPADFVTYPIDHWILHPTADLALVHLANPILTIAPLSLSASGVAPVGTTCTAVGFGDHNESDGSVTIDHKRSCTERITSVDASTITVQMVSGIADHGDSGGPLLCGSGIVGVVRDHTDGAFPNHTHENYTPVDTAWFANVLPPVPSIVVQRASDTFLWTIGPDGAVQRLGTGLGMEPGTDLSIAAVAGRSYELAWNGGGGQLWTFEPTDFSNNNDGHFTGHVMVPGTTPVIAGLSTGGAQIVFQNVSDNLLWTIGPDGIPSRIGNGLGIAAGTRPGLAGLAGGGYEIAWNGGGGQLWTLGPDNIGRFTGHVMSPGASPVVVGLSTGGAQIVFQNASDSLLWTIGPDGTVSRIGNGLGIAAGTRPALSALVGGGYEIAWNGGSGQLWTLGPDNIGRFTGYLMRSDASPGIAPLPGGGAEIAFVAETGFLWTLTPDGAARASQVDVKAGTNPAINPFQFGLPLISPAGRTIVVQRAFDTLLWTLGPDGAIQRIGNGLGMEPGTDANLAALAGGGYEIAWNGGGGQLWTLGSDNIGRFTGYFMTPKASPAITGLSTGGAQIVFQNASDGLLWTIGPSGAASRVGNGLGIAAGTRLGLTALAGGGYEIAWNGGGGQLWTLGPDNIGRFTGHVMTASASPAVTGLSTGGARIVFQKASDSLLWTIAPDGTVGRIGNGLGIAAGTRPGITALAGGGYEIAWNGDGGQLWTLGPDNIGRFTGYLMRSDATPGIAALAGGAEVAFVADTGSLWTLTPNGAVRASQVDVNPGTNPGISSP